MLSRPHLSTVTHLQFFPSSRVLLSSGADFSLTILPAEPIAPGSNGARISPVRTLRGHTRSVTSTAIIGPGRNILSSSLDSTVKLWDVSSSSIITSLNASSPVLSMSLGERTPVPPDGEEPASLADGANAHISDPREVAEAQSKIMFCGLQDGTFEIFDLGSKSSAYRSSHPSAFGALTAVSYSQDHHLLATGSAKGSVTLYDIRALATPLTSFERNDSQIEDLRFVNGESEVGLAIATADGLPYVAGIVPEGPMVRAELVGTDCDPVKSIRVRTGERRMEVWSAGNDAVVRRYLV